MDSMQAVEIDHNAYVTDQINYIIEHQLRPRLRRFEADVALLGVSHGTARVVIKKSRVSMFDIWREVLEKIVVSKIKHGIPSIKKVIVTW